MTRTLRTLPLGLALSLALIGCGGTKDDGTDTDTDPTVDTAVEDDGDDSIDDANDMTDLEIGYIDVTADQAGYTTVIDPGRIVKPGDRDFYALTLEQGETYEFVALHYFFSQVVVLDTVMRLYDTDKKLVSTNDDMPYRFQETDSLIIFTAPSTGTYYVEVLEWSDWTSETDDTVEPEGGFDYDYQLWTGRLPDTEADPNGTMDDVLIGDAPGTPTATPTATPATSPTPTSTPVEDTDTTSPTDDFYTLNVFSNYSYDFVGQFDTSDDVDWWPYYLALNEDTEEDYAFLAFSLWPDSTDTNPGFAVYDDQGRLLAETLAAEPDAELGLWYDDVGLLTRALRDQVYYIKVTNPEGKSGITATYPAMTFTYLPSLANEESEPNNARAEADFAPLEANDDNTAYRGAMWGELPPSDASDWFRIAGADVGGLAGQYVNVWVKANGQGSQLDAQFTLVDDADTELKVVTNDPENNDHADPVLRDYKVDGLNDLWIHLEGETKGTEELAHQYIISFIVSPEPVFNTDN